MNKEQKTEELSYERKPGEAETLGDDHGVLTDIPREALKESEKARHTFVKDQDGKIVAGKHSGDPEDPYSEERISNEPRLYRSEEKRQVS